jgi:hypothetical protein
MLRPYTMSKWHFTTIINYTFALLNIGLKNQDFMWVFLTQRQGMPCPYKSHTIFLKKLRRYVYKEAIEQVEGDLK